MDFLNRCKEESRIVMSSDAEDTAEFTTQVGESHESWNSGESEAPAKASSGKSGKLDAADFHNWGVYGNGKFLAATKTIKTLPPGVYRFAESQAGLLFVKVKVVTDNLFHLADTVSQEVIKSIENFWNSRPNFQRYGMLFKRGIMLYGPPGSGKTVTVQLLANQIIERGGIVVLSEAPGLTTTGLQILRSIEPERPVINILEDLDALVERFGERDILPMLDGEDQVDNIVHVATTNYPERLDARLVNRPSRFDEIRKVDMPAANIREAYILNVMEGRDTLPKSELDRWVQDTEGMSIAHLRELVVAVMCLQRTYEATIKRLHSMKTKKPKAGNTGNSGFVAD